MNTNLRIKLLVLIIVIVPVMFALSQSGGQRQADFGYTGTVTPTSEPIINRGIQAVKHLNDRGDFASDMRLIETAKDLKDLSTLMQLSAEFQQKWKDNVKTNLLLQKAIVDALSTYDFQDKKQYIFQVTLAKDVLGKSGQIPVEMEFDFVSKLKSASVRFWNLITDADWEKDRRERIELVSHLWQRVQVEIDHTFDVNDPKNRPLGNVPVPAPNYVPGITPDDIKDPDIRSRYAMAIEENMAKARKYNLQVQLRRIEKQLPDVIDGILTEVYSQPPSSLAELENNLMRFDINELRRQKIKRIVQQNIQK